MKTITLFLFTLFSTNINAQTPCACCASAYQQFDFWVGEWIVTDTLGNKVGENSIRQSEANCLITEKWTGGSGSTGTSINYYDRTDQMWHQTWVDNQGNVLKLKGQAQIGKMILKGDLQKNDAVGMFYNQITWTLEQDGTVTQIWETFNADGQLLGTLFHGIYTKKE